MPAAEYPVSRYPCKPIGLHVKFPNGREDVLSVERAKELESQGGATIIEPKYPPRMVDIRLCVAMGEHVPGDEIEVAYGMGVSMVEKKRAELLRVTRGGLEVTDDPALKYVGQSRQKRLASPPRNKMLASAGPMKK